MTADEISALLRELQDECGYSQDVALRFMEGPQIWLQGRAPVNCDYFEVTNLIDQVRSGIIYLYL